MGNNVNVVPLRSIGYQQITTLTTATALTVPAGAVKALMQAEGQDVRYRDDGTDPTAAIGMILKADVAPILLDVDLKQFKAIEEVVGGILNITYLGFQ